MDLLIYAYSPNIVTERKQELQCVQKDTTLFIDLTPAELYLLTT